MNGFYDYDVSNDGFLTSRLCSSAKDSKGLYSKVDNEKIEAFTTEHCLPATLTSQLFMGIGEIEIL